MFMTAVPAYGQDYKSKKEVMEAWNAGADFLVCDIMRSGYINKDDAPRGATINIRYKKQTQVLPIKVK